MIVTLLTDYGHQDEFVGVCHGVVRKIDPAIGIVDITHGIPRHDVRRGAVVLRNAIGYMPVGVHVAVVDPEVGTERRALALRCADERILLGPDNGLLSLAWERCGGIVDAVDVTRSPYRLEPVSATFHGRDLFVAVAARLATGAELAEAGERVEPGGLTRLDLPVAGVEDRALVAHALAIDRFGNVALNVGHDQLAGTGLALGRAVEVDANGRSHPAVFAQTFADVRAGEMIVYEDAYRSLAVAINRGDAAAVLGIGPDDEVRLRPR